MSKKKRVRRDLERFHRSGRHWELLRLLDSDNAASVHAREHKEAWQAVVRQAVRERSGFERFCCEVGALRMHPGDSDFRLLMLLKGFVEKQNPAHAILQLKGLNPSAEQLRSRFAAFASNPVSHNGKLKSLLEKFIREPDKVTRRYYEQVAGLLAVNSLSGKVSDLGCHIPSFRRLTQKAAMSWGWNDVPLAAMKAVDRKLLFLAADLPPALQDILLHPFLHHLAALCRRLAPDTTLQHATRCVKAFSFLFPRLAGDRWTTIKSRLLNNLEGWAMGTDHDPATIEERLSLLPLEAKVALLARLRGRYERCASRSERLPMVECLDEADDDWVCEGQKGFTHRAKAILAVHRSLLAEFSMRTRTLPPREKRELVRIMEPILCTDLPCVIEAMAGPEELVEFLRSILDSGCAGTRLGMLGLLAGAFYRDRELQKRAEKVLDQLAEPTMDEVRWLADEWIELYYPSARSLRPLLKRYADHRRLLLLFVNRLCCEVESELADFAAGAGLTDFMADLFSEDLKQPLKNPGILRRELEELQDYSVLDLARLFLACYPDDRLTRQGHLRWFSILHTSQPEGFWRYLGDDLRRFQRTHGMGSHLPATLDPHRAIQGEKVAAVFLFLKERLKELPTVPIDDLGPLLDNLLQYPEHLTREHRLLIQIYNLLLARLESGDETVRPLVDKIKNILLLVAKPARKAATARRKRR